MKGLIFALLFVLASSTNSYCQTFNDDKVLALSSKINGASIIIKENTKIKIRFKDSFFPNVKGKLIILNDSTIRVKSIEIPISSIASLFIKQPVSKTVGAILASIGSIGILSGTYLHSTAQNIMPLDGIQRAVGTLYIITGTGVTVLGLAVANIRKECSLEKCDILIMSK